MTDSNKALQSTSEDIAKWRSVFIERRADFITLDGWTGRPAREQVGRAVADGFLAEDARTSARQSDEQYTAVCFRPTEALRAAITQTPGQPSAATNNKDQSE